MENFAVKMEDGNYIEHHGIKGQQWGVKNGPPYPLDRISTKSLIRKKAKLEKIRDESKSGKRYVKKAVTSAALGAGVGALQGVKQIDMAETAGSAFKARTGINSVVNKKQIMGSNIAANAAINAATSAAGTYLADQILKGRRALELKNINAELKRRGVSGSNSSSVISRNKSKTFTTSSSKKTTSSNKSSKDRSFMDKYNQSVVNMYMKPHKKK